MPDLLGTESAMSHGTVSDVCVRRIRHLRWRASEGPTLSMGASVRRRCGGVAGPYRRCCLHRRHRTRRSTAKHYQNSNPVDRPLARGDYAQVGVSVYLIIRRDALEALPTVIGLPATQAPLPHRLPLVIRDEANRLWIHAFAPATLLRGDTTATTQELPTPLMQAAPSAGIDLPLKILVWDDAEGDTYVTYTDLRHLDQQHHFQGQTALTKTIDGAVSSFAAAAAG